MARFLDGKAASEGDESALRGLVEREAAKKGRVSLEPAMPKKTMRPKPRFTHRRRQEHASAENRAAEVSVNDLPVLVEGRLGKTLHQERSDGVDERIERTIALRRLREGFLDRRRVFEKVDSERRPRPRPRLQSLASFSCGGVDR